ncbi:MAG: DNA translocase FtsK [Clostridia bacterium]|nr:DNA translocase FtsK [Clostridia bacterium]
MVVIGILLFVLIYAETGTIGAIIGPALGGIIGKIKYIIPIGFFALGIKMMKDKKNYLSSKLTQYAIFLGCIASLLTIFQASKGTIDLKGLSFSETIELAYELGEESIGGGAVGAVIAYVFVNLLGMLGGAILSCGIVALSLVFTFGIRPSKIYLNVADKLEEIKEEQSEELQAINERRKQRREKKNQVLDTEFEESDVNYKKAKIDKKQNKKTMLKPAPEAILDNQIAIDLNEDEEPEEENLKFLGLFDRKKSKDNSEEKMIKSEAEKVNPNEIEANLFKQEEEVKESKVKEVLQLEHNTIIVEDENYEYPPIELLKQGSVKANKGSKKTLADIATKLQKTLHSFGVAAKVENVSVGPAITRYELKPAEGVRVSKIANLADDIALSLAAESIRIEAPIPGKQAVGIEVPNLEKEFVNLRDIIESPEFNKAESKLAFALGKDIAGDNVVTDIAKMPHVLIAGSTGSGKSVCINTLITSIIYKAKPSEVKLVMVDPKVVELSAYNGIPHLLIPVVTDPRKAAGALAWAVQEMVNRYSLFAEKSVRNIKGYNECLEANNLEGKLPHIVIIIDELADLMMVAKKEVEDAICRLAQMARAAGMHLVIATQRPSVDVITGIIKANIPSRIAFAVSSQIDSRTILDACGAEKLLGKGDMLFYPIGASKPTRIQGAFIDDKEVEKIVDFLKANAGGPVYNEDILEEIEKANKTEKQIDEEEDSDDDADEFLMDAIESVIEIGQASTSFIQRRFKVGYARAGRIIDQMEARGIISGYEGSKPRKVLMPKERWEELKMTKAPLDGDNSEEGL